MEAITQKQLGYLKSLLSKYRYAEKLNVPPEEMTKRTASSLISFLVGNPTELPEETDLLELFTDNIPDDDEEDLPF